MAFSFLAAAPYIIAAAQAASKVGAEHYAGKRIEKQREENKRAEARAAMISSLTGARAMAQPEVYEASAAERGFGALGTVADTASTLLPLVQSKSFTTAGQTQSNPIMMPNTDVVAPRYITPALQPRPNRIMGGIHNPLPTTGLSGVGYTNPSIPYS